MTSKLAGALRIRAASQGTERCEHREAMSTAPDDRLSRLMGCIDHLSTNDLTFAGLRVQFDDMIAGKAAQSAATHGASRINNRGRTLAVTSTTRAAAARPSNAGSKAAANPISGAYT